MMGNTNLLSSKGECLALVYFSFAKLSAAIWEKLIDEEKIAGDAR